METIPASVFPICRVPLLRVPGLFGLVGTGGIGAIDRSQGVVHKLSPNLSIGKRGPLRMVIHSMCTFGIDWMPNMHAALIKRDHVNDPSSRLFDLPFAKISTGQ